MHNHCLNCGRELTDPKAQITGYGSGCFRSKKQRVEHDGWNSPFDSFLFDESDNENVVLWRRGGENGVAMTNVHQQKVRHSPRGFDWRRDDCAAADLALNILLKFNVLSQKADRLYQTFKDEFITVMPVNGGVIDAVKIREWINQR